MAKLGDDFVGKLPVSIFDPMPFEPMAAPLKALPWQQMSVPHTDPGVACCILLTSYMVL
jgi:hypothetical protein